MIDDYTPDCDAYEMRHLLAKAPRRDYWRAQWLRIQDLGLFRRVLHFNPLTCHVVVCGFPRSGSTLLQAMIESCVADIHTFGTETYGWYAAQYALRHESFMLTKRPRDIYWIGRIRELYIKRRANVRFVLTLRDPRSILTSYHAQYPGNYYVSTGRWKRLFERFLEVQHDTDVCVVRYEDLVTDTEAVQTHLDLLLQWHRIKPFRDYQQNLAKDFDTTAMHSVRPVDHRGLESWKKLEHQPRVLEILKEIPQLPQYLVDLGYETNDDWCRKTTLV